MEKSGNRTVLVGIAFFLPLLFIGVVFLSTYIPSASIETRYDFVYATCNEGSVPFSYNCSNYLSRLYKVSNGLLTLQVIPPDLDSDRDGIVDVEENYRTRLFLHDTATDESQEITLPQAQAYNLRELITSPDGVALEWEYDNRNDFFFIFGGSSQYGYYLTKGDARKKLNLISDTERNYYRDDFIFIGWVLD